MYAQLSFKVTNLFGMNGPRKLKAYLPAVQNGNTFVFKDGKKNEDSIHWKFKNDKKEDVIRYKNKEPIWSESKNFIKSEHKAYIVSFIKGRIEKGSVKNFQLVEENKEENVLLQFGRKGDDVFAMDFSYPLSPLQAFAISLSALDNKYACE